MAALKGYKEVHLLDLIEEFGEDKVKELLETFSCPLNKDLEKFIKTSAIEFSKQRKAQTFLVFGSYKKELALLGYYTIVANKHIVIKASVLSNAKKKKALRCGELSQCGKKIFIATPLIAQLGKNYSNDAFPGLIKGKDLLNMACSKVEEIQYIGGGVAMYLECVPESKLTLFYNENGFYEFDKRNIDSSEQEDMVGYNCLVQMVRVN